VAAAEALYITAAYWFTGSTSFANPAVTIARAATDTFAGIRPADVPGFIAAQVLGGAIATFLFGWLVPAFPHESPENMENRKRVLFLCTGNSARSQMAEALLRHLAGDRYDVFSAVSAPNGLHPRTIDAMKEIGVDVSGQHSKHVSEFEGQQFDYVITVCDRARQTCPVFPGSKNIHWGFDDPVEAPEEDQPSTFARVRDEILQRVRLFSRL
jgi:arsenate reductase